jgi:hypothetical protein
MNLYDVVIKKGYSGDSTVELKLLAVDVEKAGKDAKRYAKANYYSSPEVISVEKVCKIDVNYKS